MKSLLSLFLVFWLVSCGSSKKITATVVNQKQADTVQTVTTEKVSVVTEHYADTLRATLPLPKLTKVPVRYEVSSAGGSIVIDITDTDISYVAIPKKTGAITANSEKTTKTNAGRKVETVVDHKATEERKPWRPPFWSYLVLIALLVALYYCLKNRLKPF